MHGGTKSSLYAYLFMKGSFSKPVQGKLMGRLFPLFTIDEFVAIMYDYPVFVKKNFERWAEEVVRITQSARTNP